MAIYPHNIRTRQSAIEGQYDDSGGRISPFDYVVNNSAGDLLPPLTEIDRAGGRVDLAKCYLSVETLDQSSAEDAYSYLDQVPADESVDVMLFRPSSLLGREGHTDTRFDAVNYVQAYQIQSNIAPWLLRGLHVAGMATITFWSSTYAKLPEVGSSLFLIEAEGTSAQKIERVQIASYTHAVETFEHSQGTQIELYNRRIIVCTLTNALTQPILGDEVAFSTPPVATGTTLTIGRNCVVRESVVADAARFYGMSTLAEAALQGDTQVRVDSVYGYAAPTARGETAISAVPALNTITQEIISGGTTFTVSAKPHTDYEMITAATRRTIYTKQLRPIAGAGCAVVAHVRMLNKWYTITEGDDESAAGTLTYNRQNGSASLTLTALPDADNPVMFQWGSSVHYDDFGVSSVESSLPLFRFALKSGLDRATLTATWLGVDGTEKTATAAADGTIAGDGTGYVSSEGIGWLQLAGDAFISALTDAITIRYNPQPLYIENNYVLGDEITANASSTPTSASEAVKDYLGSFRYYTISLKNKPKPGSLTVKWVTIRQIPTQIVSEVSSVVTEPMYAPSIGTDSPSDISVPTAWRASATLIFN
jgi:hypothetical protein